MSIVRPFTTRVQWSEAIGRERPATWDGGLMPLPDDVYARAKCGYKLLQYCCAGLPVIGSPVGVNAALLARSGSPAPEHVSDWVEAVESLFTMTEAERAAIGAKCLTVAAAYSYEVWQARWMDAVGWTLR